MKAIPYSRGCNLHFALLLVIGGLFWIGVGLYAARTHLQQIDGVVTHSENQWGAPRGRRLVDYDYTVAGQHYHGQCYVSYFRAFDWYLQDGSRILVWYDDADPSVSYPVRRPFPFASVVVGFIPIILGIVVGGFALQKWT